MSAPATPAALLAMLLGSFSAPSAAASEMGELEQFLSGPDEPYRAELRITSRPRQGDGSVSRLVVQRSDTGDVRQIEYRLTTNGVTRHWCLRCAAAAGLRDCPMAPQARSIDLARDLPDTLLPWEELVLGACGGWTITPLPSAPTAAAPSYQVDFRSLGPEQGSRSALIAVDASGVPSSIEHRNADGERLRTIRLLETGTHAGFTGARRALIDRPDGQVLLELRNIQIGPPDRNWRTE